MLDPILYDVCLCDYFGGNYFARTATLGTYEVSETKIGAGEGWGAITGDFVVSSDGDIG